MRTFLLSLLALALGLTLALATAAQAPAKPMGPAYRFRPATAEAPPFDAASNDNLGRVIYNHFANPAAGQALIETWTRQDRSDLGLPINNQGVASASRLHNVARIALRVTLHTRGGTTSSDVSGPTYNSGNLGDPLIFNALSPTLDTGGLVPNPAYCESWTTVSYAIRWADDTLTAGKVLSAPSRLINRNCDVN